MSQYVPPKDWYGPPLQPPPQYGGGSTWGNNDQYSTQPVGPQYSPAQVTNPVQLSAPGWMDWNNPDWARGDGAQKALQNWNTYLPYLQYRQNAYQYGMDFNEAARRWQDQFNWQKQGDQFAQGLAGRQEDRAWWTAQQAADQWGKQFGLDSELGRGRLGLDSELGRGNLQLGRDKMNTEAQVAREGYANQQKIANINAFGRAQTPNARWLRSW